MELYKCQKKSSLFSSISRTLLICLASENRPIKCLNISSLCQKNPNKNILCVLRATDCPFFEVKTKIVSVPSDVINRSKSIDYSTNCVRPVVHLEARTRFGDITKINIKYLDFMGKFISVVFSIKPRKGDG